jgi:hypothetical protein
MSRPLDVKRYTVNCNSWFPGWHVNTDRVHQTVCLESLERVQKGGWQTVPTLNCVSDCWSHIRAERNLCQWWEDLSCVCVVLPVAKCIWLCLLCVWWGWAWWIKISWLTPLHTYMHVHLPVTTALSVWNWHSWPPCQHHSLSTCLPANINVQQSLCMPTFYHGTRGTQWHTWLRHCATLEGHGFDSRWCHWNFFLLT